MSAQRRAVDRRTKWRSAYECAKKVNDLLRREPPKNWDDRMAQDFSAIILNAMSCMETNKKISAYSFTRASRYLSSSAETPLRRVCYSLLVLLERLLTDRADRAVDSNGKSSAPKQNEPSTSGEDNLWDQKEEPVKDDGSIKQEPMDIKEEPVDDYEAVKQEPIADVFCPTTGESRPPDQSLAHYPTYDYAELGRDGDEGAQLYCRRKDVPKDESTRFGRCFACKALPDKFYSTPTNPGDREAFLNRIIRNMKTDLDHLYFLKKGHEAAFFCVEHVASRPAESQQSKSRPKKPIHFTQTCELCGEKGRDTPYLVSPKDHATARIFFKNLVDMDETQLALIDTFLENGWTMTVCKKHHKTLPSILNQAKRTIIMDEEIAVKTFLQAANPKLKRPRLHIDPANITKLPLRMNRAMAAKSQAKQRDRTEAYDSETSRLREQQRLFLPHDSIEPEGSAQQPLPLFDNAIVDDQIKEEPEDDPDSAAFS